MRTMSVCAAVAVALTMTVPAAAQTIGAVDPRLGTMKSAWIDIDTDTSQARPIAACFRARLEAWTPLTAAPTKSAADVVLHFETDSEVWLVVALPDDTPYYPSGTRLWTTPRVQPRTYAFASSELACTLAEALAAELRVAIRHARGESY